MDALVGRQPILDANNRTLAYELLFRSGMENRFDGSDGDSATGAVITNTFVTIGCNRVLGGKRGFINLTRTLLVEEKALILPSNRVVIEVLENVEPDAEVMEACRKLKSAGYRIALDDVTAANFESPLMLYARYAKLDWPAIEESDRRRICGQLKRKGVRLLAEKVETKAAFQAARSFGCELFQGFYFAHPEILSARQVPASKLACLRLVGEIQREELDFAKLEAIVRVDVGLTQRLLTFANSAIFSCGRHISTLSHAFVVLGENNIRRWVTMAALSSMASGKPAELVTLSLTRARFCELAAENSGLRRRSSSCFLIGLLSLLDVMIGTPLSELVQELGLESHVSQAILGASPDGDHLASVLRLTVALERTDYEAAGEHAAAIGLPFGMVGELQFQAMVWADSIPT